MGRNPASWYYWDDHHKDIEDEQCDIDGAWRRVLYKCHWAKNRGTAVLTLQQWAHLFRTDVENAYRMLQRMMDINLGVFKMLKTCGNPVDIEIPFDISALGQMVLSHDPNAIISITNRRMAKETKQKESNKKRQQKHYYKDKEKEQPNA